MSKIVLHPVGMRRSVENVAQQHISAFRRNATSIIINKVYYKRGENALFVLCESLCSLCSLWLNFLTTKAQRTQRFTEKNVLFLAV